MASTLPGDVVCTQYSGHSGRSSDVTFRRRKRKALVKHSCLLDIGQRGRGYLRSFEIVHLLRIMVEYGLRVSLAWIIAIPAAQPGCGEWRRFDRARHAGTADRRNRRSGRRELSSSCTPQLLERLATQFLYWPAMPVSPSHVTRLPPRQISKKPVARSGRWKGRISPLSRIRSSSWTVFLDILIRRSYTWLWLAFGNTLPRSGFSAC